MLLAKARISFHDAENGNVLRAMGEAFECDDKRGEYLASLGLVDVTKVQAPRKASQRKATKEV